MADKITATVTDLDLLAGQTSPARPCRRIEPHDARLLEALVAWELVQGRRAQSRDEAEVRDRLQQMDAATATVWAARVAS